MAWAGDWVQIMEDDYTLIEGHRIGTRELVILLRRFTKVELVELTDEQMEEGDF